MSNGTCVSFCNQPKAHFGLPWVRPGDNRGKCHMDEKRIQCMSNASQHAYPSIFNRLRAIVRYLSEIATLPTRLHLTPRWGVLIGIPGENLVLRKLVNFRINVGDYVSCD